MHTDPLAELLATQDADTAQEARALHTSMLDLGINPDDALVLLAKVLELRATPGSEESGG